MGEVKKFLQLLFRYRYLLLIVPVITVIIAFFLVRNLPDVYMSQAQIATGIVDETQQLMATENNQQESSINREFSNLIEMMRMKKIIDQVSYQLILHDLSAEKPFRSPSKLMKDLNEDARTHANEVFTQKYTKKEGLNLWDKDQNGLYQVIRSMGYDEESLKNKLTIYRADVSDFINVEFSSENPELSAFVSNTLCKEFITYYTSIVKENQHKSVTFLGNLLQQKTDTLNQRVDQLKDYKIENRILNLDEQSRQMYTQVTEFELRKQQAEKDIAAYKGAIENIDAKFNPRDRRYFESTLTRINQDILETKRELQALSDSYIKNDFDEKYKQSIDSLKDVLNSQISVLSDKYIYNPMNTKQDLIQQKLNLQIQYDLALYSLSTINKELNRLNQRFDKLVPHEAVIQTYERRIDIASKEYLDILDQYNKSSMQSGFSVKLRQVQQAMPGMAQASKKMLLIILSGIISLVFCVLVLFIIFFFDDSIVNAKDLAEKTNIPVLGSINLIHAETFSLSDIWKTLQDTEALQQVRNELRSIRFEVNRELFNMSTHSKTLAITSIREGEGKTFFAASLAYTHIVVNKKVLLIDGNFDRPTITQTSDPQYFIEDYLMDNRFYNFPTGITIMGNRGGDKSLFEIGHEDLIRTKLDQLKSQFHLVLIEIPPLDALNKAKEWIMYSDKVTAVFQANQSLNEAKKQHINYLKSLSDKFIGWVINKVVTER